jgi:hypothetical protein
MEGNIKEIGRMENNTEMENFFRMLKEVGKKETGAKEKEPDG